MTQVQKTNTKIREVCQEVLRRRGTVQARRNAEGGTPRRQPPAKRQRTTTSQGSATAVARSSVSASAQTDSCLSISGAQEDNEVTTQSLLSQPERAPPRSTAATSDLSYLFDEN